MFYSNGHCFSHVARELVNAADGGRGNSPVIRFESFNCESSNGIFPGAHRKLSRKTLKYTKRSVNTGVESQISTTDG